MGVYPFVVPFRPLAGTLAVDATGRRRRRAALLADVTARVADGAAARPGCAAPTRSAGCAACGACSVLQNAGG